MDKSEYNEIKRVCEKYGYGNVMTLASALWEHELKQVCENPKSMFVPTIYEFVTNNGRRMLEQSMTVYRAIIERMEKE